MTAQEHISDEANQSYFTADATLCISFRYSEASVHDYTGEKFASKGNAFMVYGGSEGIYSSVPNHNESSPLSSNDNAFIQGQAPIWANIQHYGSIPEKTTLVSSCDLRRFAIRCLGDLPKRTPVPELGRRPPPLAVEIHQNVGTGGALPILGHQILCITYLRNELSIANLDGGEGTTSRNAVFYISLPDWFATRLRRANGGGVGVAWRSGDGGAGLYRRRRHCPLLLPVTPGPVGSVRRYFTQLHRPSMVAARFFLVCFVHAFRATMRLEVVGSG
nr:transmembrane protein 87A-like [Ipomoea batatas]